MIVIPSNICIYVINHILSYLPRCDVYRLNRPAYIEAVMAIKDIYDALKKADGRGLLPRYIITHRRNDVHNMTTPISSKTFSNEEDVFMRYIHALQKVHISTVPDTLSRENLRTILDKCSMSKDMAVILYKELSEKSHCSVRMTNEQHTTMAYTAEDIKYLGNGVYVDYEDNMALSYDLGFSSSFSSIQRDCEHNGGGSDPYVILMNIIPEYEDAVTNEGRRALTTTIFDGIGKVLENLYNENEQLRRRIESLEDRQYRRR